MNYSPYQRAIFDAIRNTKRHIIVGATAGSGKTTTIVEAAKLIPQDKKVLFLAFNKAIVEELKGRLPRNVECSTLHSLGLKQLRLHLHKNIRVSEWKITKYAEEYTKDEFPNEDQRTDKIKANINIRSILTYARLNKADVPEKRLEKVEDDPIFNIVSYYGIMPLGREEHIARLVWKDINWHHQRVLEGHIHPRQAFYIDYTDMIYLPTQLGLPMTKYDYIFVDELQDLNRAQRDFVLSLLEPRTGRLVGVGDKRQAIYAFGGADIASFEAFESMKNSVTLPLSISYRCAKNIVAKAQTVYNDIETYDGQEEGEVRYGKLAEAQPGDMVISRITKPLIESYFLLLEHGIKAKIKGREFEEALLNLLRKVSKYDPDEALIRLREMRQEMIEKLKGKIKNPHNHPRVVAFDEYVEIIERLTRNVDSLDEVHEMIRQIFEDDGKEDLVHLMTIHKSKGLEADRVFVVEKYNNLKLMPFHKATKNWEKEQERNLEFVAYTRAKKELVLIEINDEAASREVAGFNSALVSQEGERDRGL